ncbi:MAG TPA: M28 family peptidase [Gemmatimonadaceae bacterium]
MPHDASSEQTASNDVTAQGAAHLAALARAPRAAGSAAEQEAREYCARVLRAAGFDVALEPFDYSQLPGRYGTPVGGAIAWVTVAATSWLGATGSPAFFSALVCLAGLAILGMWSWQMLGDGVLALPWRRASAVNLVATRGGPTPRVWLVAHLDSKSQPIPSLLRVAGVVMLATSLAVTIAAALLTLGGAELRTLWWIGAVLATGGAVPVIGSVVGNDSNGALDNASGVATVLEAVQSPMQGSPIGVLLPSAEELGLAGARAWALQRCGEQGIAINCDGVDDGGALTIMYSGTPSIEIFDTIRDSAAEPVRVRRMPLGLLLDSVALTEAGWRSVTVSRGSLASLRRVHTRADSLEQLRGVGISRTATVLARAAEALAR